MSLIVVKISDMKFSKLNEDALITYSLGSCLGVTVYDPVTRVGAMLHALLPSAASSPQKAKENPYMFVTSGIAGMVKTMFRIGARRGNLIFKIAGGGNMRGDKFFRTGDRNVESVINLLNKNKIKISGQDVGGNFPRTMSLHMDTGKVVLRTLGKEFEI